MKRLFSILLTLALLFSLTACGGKASGTTAESPENNQTQEDSAPDKAPEKDPEPEQAAAPIPLQLMKGEGYLYETNEEYISLCTATWDDISLIDAYPELASALYELNTDQSVGAYGFIQEFLPFAEEAQADSPEYFGSFTSSSEYAIQRADSLILSIREDYDSYTGGVHGNYGSMGWNFDTATGARFELTDILTNTDRLDEILSEKISAKYTFDPFESLPEMLAEYAPEDYTWTLGYQGITFYFSPYEIAPYAAGLLTATIWFDEMPELFYEEYTVAPEGGYAVALPYYNEADVDLDAGDNMRDALSYWTYEGEYGEKYLTISLNGQYYTEESWCAFSVEPYLVCVEDNFYLYVEGSGDNDYRTLYIYDLNGSAPQLISDFPGAGFVGIWDEDAGVDGIYYTVLFNDPYEFTLGSKCNLLGTKTAYRNYTVDTDGTLYPLSDTYDLDQTLDSIISTIPLDVTLLPQSTVETVPAGTEFFFLRTDNETWVDLVMTDGQECRIVIEEIDWTPCINGVPEWECFEDLMYAG